MVRRHPQKLVLETDDMVALFVVFSFKLSSYYKQNEHKSKYVNYLSIKYFHIQKTRPNSTLL